MITAVEVAQGTYGAWRLARCDSDGLRYFGDNQFAFWRSFYAGLVAAPAYLILVLLRMGEGPVGTSGLQLFIVEILGYVCGWVAFPLAMIYVAQSIGRWGRYYRYIVAYNWAAVLQILLLLIVAALTAGAAPGTATLVQLAAVAVVLAYQWYVAKVALDVPGTTALGVVLVDLTLGIFINILTRAFS